MQETVFARRVNSEAPDAIPVGDVAGDVVRDVGARSNMALVGDQIIMDLRKMRLATMRYSLEDVGRAGRHFSSLAARGTPSVNDAVALNDHPSARACFIELVEAIAKPSDLDAPVADNAAGWL